MKELRLSMVSQMLNKDINIDIFYWRNDLTDFFSIVHI